MRGIAGYRSLSCYTAPRLMKFDIYMHSWIVADGNYRDFREGETRQFALEFWAPNFLSMSERQEKSVTSDSRYTYRINAQVTYSSAEILVIDFGVLAYSEAAEYLQLGVKAGDFVNGQIALGVDPFFYFEQ